MRLPIDLVDGSYPPRFKWVAPAVLPYGSRNCECEGSLQPGVDVAVRDLIIAYRKLAQEVVELRERVGQAQPTEE